MRDPTVTDFFSRVTGFFTAIFTLGFLRPTPVSVAVVNIGSKRRIIESGPSDCNDDSNDFTMPGAWPEANVTPLPLPVPLPRPVPAIASSPSPKLSPPPLRRSQVRDPSPKQSPSKIRRAQAYNHFWEQRRRLGQPLAASTSGTLGGSRIVKGIMEYEYPQLESSMLTESSTIKNYPFQKFSKSDVPGKKCWCH
jgi:hypothetical protein